MGYLYCQRFFVCDPKRVGMVVCDTVVVEGETAGVDELYSIENVRATSNFPGIVTVEATLSRNNRGAGGDRFVSLFVTIDGNRVGNERITLPPGTSSTASFEIENVSEGQAEVCAGIEPAE